MNFSFIYEPDFIRIIYASYIANRASIPDLKNKTGVEIKAYIDSKVSNVNPQSIVYKIENDNGNMAGFFTLQVNTVNKTAITGDSQILNSFANYISQISNEIIKFTNNNSWKQDYLF